MTFKYSDWPPVISKSQLADLTVHATTYALAHGLLYLPPGQSQPRIPASAIHAPLALLPSPIPKKLFFDAKRLQSIYNVLYARIAMDDDFLDTVMGAEQGLGKVDPFIGQLWKGWKQLREGRVAQVSQLPLVQIVDHNPCSHCIWEYSDRIIFSIRLQAISICSNRSNSTPSQSHSGHYRSAFLNYIGNMTRAYRSFVLNNRL